MAKAEEVKQDAKVSNGSGANRFTKVVTDRPMYRPDKCSEKPLVGYLIGLTAMPPRQLSQDERAAGKTGAWNAYVILTTEPTLACNSKGERPVAVPAGVEVIIGESAVLQELRKYLSPGKMIEVSISTTGKMDLDGGKSKRTFDIGADFDHAVTRPAKYALPATGLPPAKQLTAGEVETDEIPF